MLLEEFKKYIRGFNTANYEVMTSFFTPDITLDLPSGQVLEGIEAVKKFYQAFRKDTGDEVLDMREFFYAPTPGGKEGDGDIFYEMHAWFHYTRAPGGVTSIPGHPVPKLGELVRLTTWARYNVVGGKFKRIRVALFKYENLGKADSIPQVEGRLL